MDLSSFGDLPDDAQLWVFGFARPLSKRDRENIKKHLDAFLPRWTSHQIPVRGAYTVLYDRFVLVAGHCPEGLSGCSMDSCVSNFKQLKARCGLDALDRSLVFTATGKDRCSAWTGPPSSAKSILQRSGLPARSSTPPCRSWVS